MITRSSHTEPNYKRTFKKVQFLRVSDISSLGQIIAFISYRCAIYVQWPKSKLSGWSHWSKCYSSLKCNFLLTVSTCQNISQIKSCSAASSYKVTLFLMKHESKFQFQQIPKSNQIFTIEFLFWLIYLWQLYINLIIYVKYLKIYCMYIFSAFYSLAVDVLLL